MLKENIDNFIAELIKNKQSYKVKVLRLIKSEYQKFETSGKDKVLDDATEIKILKKLQKQWKEELELFNKAGRDTLHLTLELEYLESFLPKEMTEEEQREKAADIIEKYLTGLPIEERKSMKYLGAIMKIIKDNYPTIDGKIVSEVYKKLLGY